MLSSGRKTRGYTRYSPLFYFPFYVLPDRPLQSTLEPKSRSTPEAATTTSRPPLARTRSSFGGSQAGGLAFLIVVHICASLLKATLYPCVCTQILFASADLCSRAVVFEPSWPLACIKQLVLFYL